MAKEKKKKTVNNLNEADERVARIENLSAQIKKIDQMMKASGSNPSKLLFEEYKVKRQRLESDLIDELAEAIINKPPTPAEAKELSAWVEKYKERQKNSSKKYNQDKSVSTRRSK